MPYKKVPAERKIGAPPKARIKKPIPQRKTLNPTEYFVQEIKKDTNEIIRRNPGHDFGQRLEKVAALFNKFTKNEFRQKEQEIIFKEVRLFLFSFKRRTEGKRTLEQEARIKELEDAVGTIPLLNSTITDNSSYSSVKASREKVFTESLELTTSLSLDFFESEEKKHHMSYSDLHFEASEDDVQVEHVQPESNITKRINELLEAMNQDAIFAKEYNKIHRLKGYFTKENGQWVATAALRRDYESQNRNFFLMSGGHNIKKGAMDPIDYFLRNELYGKEFIDSISPISKDCIFYTSASGNFLAEEAIEWVKKRYPKTVEFALNAEITNEKMKKLAIEGIDQNKNPTEKKEVSLKVSAVEALHNFTIEKTKRALLEKAKSTSNESEKERLGGSLSPVQMSVMLNVIEENKFFIDELLNKLEARYLQKRKSMQSLMDDESRMSQSEGAIVTPSPLHSDMTTYFSSIASSELIRPASTFDQELYDDDYGEHEEVAQFNEFNSINHCTNWVKEESSAIATSNLVSSDWQKNLFFLEGIVKKFSNRDSLSSTGIDDTEKREIFFSEARFFLLLLKSKTNNCQGKEDALREIENIIGVIPTLNPNILPTRSVDSNKAQPFAASTSFTQQFSLTVFEEALHLSASNFDFRDSDALQIEHVQPKSDIKQRIDLLLEAMNHNRKWGDQYAAEYQDKDYFYFDTKKEQWQGTPNLYRDYVSQPRNFFLMLADHNLKKGDMDPIEYFRGNPLYGKEFIDSISPISKNHIFYLSKSNKLLAEEAIEWREKKYLASIPMSLHARYATQETKKIVANEIDTKPPSDTQKKLSLDISAARLFRGQAHDILLQEYTNKTLAANGAVKACEGRSLSPIDLRTMQEVLTESKDDVDAILEHLTTAYLEKREMAQQVQVVDGDSDDDMGMTPG